MSPVSKHGGDSGVPLHGRESGVYLCLIVETVVLPLFNCRDSGVTFV